MLGACARGLATGPAPAQVDVVVEVAVVGIGALVAAWMAVCAALAAVCLVLRLAGTTWRAGERAVHRLAPAVVRRALTVAVVGGLGAGLAPGAYAADAPTPTPTSASVDVSGGAVDLGWVVTAGPGGAAVDPPGNGPAGAAPNKAQPARPAVADTPPTTRAVVGSVARDASVPGGQATSAGDADQDRGAQARAQGDATASGAAVRRAGTDPDPVVGEPDARDSGAAADGRRAPGTAGIHAAAGDATAGTSPHESHARAARAATVVVRRGDSLWRIAARHLPPGAGDEAIAAAWPAWYAANRATIGDDPGLLLPGQVLAVPPEVAP
jgi:hypothetical protein